ncbi:MAG: hypothetical protein IJA00_06160, partial [Bacteroidaceae bacterium]|nr:hypothetical protein [Bacteroidaceae bacterium]
AMPTASSTCSTVRWWKRCTCKGEFLPLPSQGEELFPYVLVQKEKRFLAKKINKSSHCEAQMQFPSEEICFSQ